MLFCKALFRVYPNTPWCAPFRSFGGRYAPGWQPGGGEMLYLKRAWTIHRREDRRDGDRQVSEKKIASTRGYTCVTVGQVKMHDPMPWVRYQEGGAAQGLRGWPKGQIGDCLAFTDHSRKGRTISDTPGQGGWSEKKITAGGLNARWAAPICCLGRSQASVKRVPLATPLSAFRHSSPTGMTMGRWAAFSRF